MTLSSTQLATADARRAKLVKICSSLPEVEIQTLGEHLGIRIRKKTFAYYQFDHHGDGMIALACRSNLNDQRRLIQSDAETFFSPAYVGKRGWIGMRLDLDEVDWDTAEELLCNAYQEVAPRKLAALLDS
jgi:predicted DNA-binding protein (MmcQ/YjbR family)